MTLLLIITTRHGPWWQVEQCPVLVALEEFIESIHETLHGNRFGLADAVDVGAGQGQAAVKAAGAGRWGCPGRC